MSNQTRSDLEAGGFTIVERHKPRKSHQSSYWRPKRGGARSRGSSVEKDVEMIDSHSEAVTLPPPLPLEPRSPTPPPPVSPVIPDSVQKEIEAMDIDLFEIQDIVLENSPSLPQECTGLQDPSIIFLGQSSQQSQAEEDRIPATPQLSQPSQPELTLALVGCSNPSGYF